jgi:hypothetical protein
MNSNGSWIFVASSSDKGLAYKIANSEWGIVRVVDVETGEEV